MRLITYNVEYFEGINKRWKYLEIQKYFRIAKKNIKKVCAFLDELKPDIVGLVEIDTNPLHEDGHSTMKTVASFLNMPYCVSKNKYSRKAIYKILNHAPILRKHANAIISRYPLFDSKFYYLSKGVKRLLIHSKVKIANEGEVKELHLFVVHLSLRKKTRDIQIRDLSTILRASPSPKILFGDFNNFKGIEEITPLLDYSNLIDAVEYSNQEHSKTYPSWKPKKHLDHIFVSKDIKILNYEVLDCDLSDHKPVMIDFEL